MPAYPQQLTNQWRREAPGPNVKKYTRTKPRPSPAFAFDHRKFDSVSHNSTASTSATNRPWWLARNAAAARLQAEYERLREAIGGTEASMGAARERAESLAAEVAAAEQERDAARLALDVELELRSTQARVSRVRGTHKAEVALMLRYGRLYVWHRYDRSGRRIGLNTDEFIAVRDHGSHVETAPRPGAGIAVAAPDAKANIRGRLAAFHPARQYFAVVVWPDSFDEFQQVKRVMVENGFEYRLMPFTAGQQFVDRGGRGASVQ